MTKIAIVGSRDFTRLDLVQRFVRSLPDFTVVVTGGAFGVDHVALLTARSEGLGTVVYYPDWEQYGKKAGIIRNAHIVGECDKLIAFWNGKSRGTLNSIYLAEKLNKLAAVVRVNG